MKGWRSFGFNGMRLDKIRKPTIRSGHVIAQVLCVQPCVTEAQLACGTPARRATSLIFGGEHLTDICITSAGGQNKAVEGTAAGGLFRLEIGLRGLPEYLSRIIL